MYALILLTFIPLIVSAQPLHDRFNGATAFQYNVTVAGFGERWPGSPGHAKTEALIRKVLQGDGAQMDGDDFNALTPRGLVPVHNIIGKFNVTADPKQQIFVLAGHYDTLFQPGFLGANDAGSSTAILLSFADALAHQPMKMQIWLVFTDLEEAIHSFTADDGLYGSRHLAKKVKADGTAARMRGFFLLDMIGDRDLSVARETESDATLQAVIRRAALQLGFGNKFFQYEAGIIDDHVPFIEVGVPAVDIVDARYGRMAPNFDSMGEFHHSNQDTIDKISTASLETVGKTVLLTLEILDGERSSTPPSPPNRARRP